MNSYRDSDSQSLSFMPFTLTFSFFKVNEKFNLMLIILVFSLPGVASLLQGLADIVDAQADHQKQDSCRQPEPRPVNDVNRVIGKTNQGPQRWNLVWQTIADERQGSFNPDVAGNTQNDIDDDH